MVNTNLDGAVSLYEHDCTLSWRGVTRIVNWNAWLLGLDYYQAASTSTYTEFAFVLWDDPWGSLFSPTTTHTSST